MNINRSFKDFKFRHRSNKNQIIYTSKKIKGDEEISNLIDNFLSEKNSFIFESVEKGKIKGRYTIFGKNPDKIWEFKNNNSYLIQNKKKVKLKDKPENLIEKIIEEFKFETPKSLPKICSLISGYFSYDSIRYIEKIPNNCKDDLSIPDVRLLRPRILIIHDNLKKEIFYIRNIYKDEKIIDYQKKYDEVKSDLFRLLIQSSIKNIDNRTQLKSNNIKVKSNTSKNRFLQMVNKAKEYIKLGDIFQVVLSQRFEAKLTKKPIDIYKKLRVTNPSPFMFFFNFNDFQIIGASPEILVRLRDNKITVRPIAGTRPRGKTLSEDRFYEKDLLQDKKELSEHLMLLDLGRNDAGKVSKINTVKVTESFIIEKYSHVMHIVSNVIGVYDKKFSKFKSLLAGFPAGTVSGAPKIRAMEIIDELETTKRKVYAGGIGYFSANGEFDTCIALRTAVAKKDKFYVQAGAGIVADSKPLKEYEETVNKAKALINALK
ncbi:anthranilate synthase component I [Candidatus Pelagibacter sp. RS39]|uniref:anthranilate synthase component I n=1 Tax=Candidatus Pelagibacter sp. RS39 TaxID=1977864 RepID=UPI000A14D2DF|nr:anthranilate synthase component I [Candidatus Pelagibacter sp. RS39]ARJ47801.1 anthranilate synthase component I [Candidatus Pelagibacter sp. RS39]